MKDNWVIEGDEICIYFHGSLNQKWRQLSIRGILVDEDREANPIRVKDEFISYYHKLFSRQHCARQSISPKFSNTILDHRRQYLQSSFLVEDIKQAMWDCGIDKASGNGGLIFFRRYWDLVVEDGI